MSIQHEIAKALGGSDVAAFRLRDMFVGGFVVPKRLNGISFVQTADADGYTRWERYWNRRKNKVAVVVAPKGTLCQVDFLEWLDRANDATYAYGWYFNAKCSKRIESAIKADLQSIMFEPVETDAATALASSVEKLRPPRAHRIAEPDSAFLMCSYAFRAQGNQPALARLLCSIMVRHLSYITNPGPLYDLPFLCGRLGLLPECMFAMRHLLQECDELPATCWTNMGAVLTDNLEEHQAAALCFFEAIRRDPDLPQPRQGVWHAGTRLMRHHFIDHDFVTAAKVGDEIIAVGDKNVAPDNFFSHYGLALEMTNRHEDARKAYEQALSIDPHCSVAQEGYDRLKAADKNTNAHMTVWRVIEKGAFNGLAPEDRYPWC
jgi:tetratricopeptide (TPR) repeat protein